MSLKHSWVYIIILILVIIILLYTVSIKTTEKFTNNDNNTEIVLAYYNENIDWINTPPYNKYSVICYNKGTNKNIKIDNLKSMVYLQNIGRESHTYLYHIIQNYDNLSNITIFVMGSMSDTTYTKNEKLKLLFENLNNDSSVFICQTYKNVKKDLYTFTIDDYTSTNSENNTKNKNNVLKLSEIRPFGKWFDSNFKDIDITHVSYNSIFALNKKHILQHSKEYYIQLINQLNSPNPEVGHYFERSWEAVFFPLYENTKFIEVKTI